jgi:DNA-binding GntR family transcriptional regulator
MYRAIETADVAAAKAVMERHIQDIIETKIRQMARAEDRSVTRELTEEELHYTL